MALDFLVSIQLYSALTQPFDPKILPVHTRGYMLDSQGRYFQSEGSIMSAKPGSWIEIAGYQLNQTHGFDTTRTYFKLDASGYETRAAATMTDGPLENGSEFRYDGGRLVEQVHYASAQEDYRTFYAYENGLLSACITVEASGDTVFTQKYRYVDGVLSEADGIPALGSSSTYAFYLPDSIVIRQVGAPGETRQVLNLDNGALAKVEEISSTGAVYHYTKYAYGEPDAILPRRAARSRGRRILPETVDLLGRALPEWRGAERGQVRP